MGAGGSREKKAHSHRSCSPPCSAFLKEETRLNSCLKSQTGNYFVMCCLGPSFSKLSDVVAELFCSSQLRREHSSPRFSPHVCLSNTRYRQVSRTGKGTVTLWYQMPLAYYSPATGNRS